MASVVTSNIPPSATNRQRSGNQYASRLKCFGIANIALGTLCIVFAIVAIAVIANGVRADVTGNLTYNGSGAWGGTVVLVAGLLGFKAAQPSGSGATTAILVLSIIGAIIAGIMFGINVAAAYHNSIASHLVAQLGYQFILWPFATAAAMHSFIALAAFTSLILLIVQAVYCCRTNQQQYPVAQPMVTTSVIHIPQPSDQQFVHYTVEPQGHPPVYYQQPPASGIINPGYVDPKAAEAGVTYSNSN